ncbi:YeeE/YedE family protein [Thiomonas arsenitoxydans]|uniref:Sulphur transport domain-containing protein n=1 Tax=Thiomonas arsenitoxydans (strain DSM 22701 / CIP 110005 / 3As) TaxID=426114 RepID=D6CLG9_THIA3|nr:hypothetical protein [Thiomonas arsenitoxydans]CAZ89397.1 hypothetical protein; putative membrane protein [Thiomonas arsenitoxydans]
MNSIAQWFPLGWEPFLYGGIFIGLGVSVLFWLTGLIGGVSTAYTAVWSLVSRHPFFQHEKFITTRNWRLMYGLGLIVGAVVFTYTLGHGEGFVTQVPLWQLFLGGIVGGFGARMGGGLHLGTRHLRRRVWAVAFHSRGDHFPVYRRHHGPCGSRLGRVLKCNVFLLSQ